MKRREFITLLGGAAAWPLPLAAQRDGNVRRIGVLMPYAENDMEGQAFVAAFSGELQTLGWVQGRNLRIDYRWATPGDATSRQQFAMELVALQPDLILTQSTPTTNALMQQTRTIPILFAQAIDPVGSHFVASFPRPGGTSPVSSLWSRRWQASGWTCSSRLRRALTGSPCCSTRSRRPIANIS
jgi:putative ABC transport system substrate-binding protein